jgi:hypothetical protein
MVPLGTWGLKATLQDVSVKQEGEDKSGVERSDDQEGRNVKEVQEINDGQHKV